MERRYFDKLCQQKADLWLPACGGSEQPTEIRGRKLLYCYNPKEGRHTYVDCWTDLPLSEGESLAVMMGG